MVFKSIVTSMCICLTVVSFNANANASATFYDTRAEFLESVSGNNTDDYSTYVPGIYTDIDMSAVFGEASYEALTFPNQNQVGFVFRENFESYCSGCNGNFKLGFQSTSFSENGGVFGVGIDIILHTSRRVSIGDDNPANPTFEGSVQIQFADGSTEQILIPAGSVANK